MNNRLRSVPAFLFKWGYLIIFCLLVFTQLLILINNWGAIFFGNIRAVWVILPVICFFTAENAVKFWLLKGFTRKIPCYVLDILCLIALTVFSDGLLISTLFIIILSEFYLSQTSLVGSVAMAAASIFVFLVSLGVSGLLKQQFLNIAQLISNGFNDILLMVLHFFGFNFFLQIYRKNNELAEAIEKMEASNKKLREANEELSDNRQKLQEAYKNLQEVTVLEERQRIAKDIHDTAGHSITTIIMQTEAARLVVDNDPEEAKRKIAAANLQARNALEELRESVHLLSGNSEQLSLRERLMKIVHESTDGTGIVVRTDVDEVGLCDAKARFLCNTLKEGISNGLRHGGATAFYFELKHRGERVCFLLSDNGKGIENEQLKYGFGLNGMIKRAEALGGKIAFDSEPDEGFEIKITLPCDNMRRGEDYGT